MLPQQIFFFVLIFFLLREYILQVTGIIRFVVICYENTGENSCHILAILFFHAYLDDRFLAEAEIGQGETERNKAQEQYTSNIQRSRDRAPGGWASKNALLSHQILTNMTFAEAL